MSYDESDAARDDFYDEVRSQISEEVVKGFTADRLTSYYDNNLGIAEKPYNSLIEARKLLSEGHSTAAFIHAVITSECMIKAVLLRPIVIGLIHNEIIAPWITEMVMSQSRGQFPQVKELLLSILNELAGFNLSLHIRSGASRDLWSEIVTVQKQRNDILHKAESVSRSEAERAIAIASEIIEVVFPALVKKLGFHIHDGFRLCTKQSCSFPPGMCKLINELGMKIEEFP